ncbi:MAG: DUF72 domain-containing protein [Ginsengibacter sp.]|jgi:uncharacterized protein YecE (DUF72 family)
MTHFHTGCSGFYYKDWNDIFYPEKLPQTKWFEFYCQQFNTLEINSSFYKFPSEKSLIKWYQTSPADFKFSLKVPRLITHYKKFEDCESLLSDFYTSIRNGLQDKLGCILFQLPPQTIYSSEKLDLIVRSVDTTFKNVFEFRHISWWNEEVFTQFKKHNLIFCGVSFPKLADEAVMTSVDLYYRFHGVPVLYKSLYDIEFLQKIYHQIKIAAPREAWIYFNNTWGTAAIKNARYLQSVISDQP